MHLSDRELLNNYAHAAANLAESVKHDIQHGGVIEDNTVLALNDFIIAANAVADQIQILEDEKRILN